MKYIFIFPDDGCRDCVSYIVNATSEEEANEKLYKHLVSEEECEDLEEAKEYVESNFLIQEFDKKIIK